MPSWSDWINPSQPVNIPPSPCLDIRMLNATMSCSRSGSTFVIISKHSSFCLMASCNSIMSRYARFARGRHDTHHAPSQQQRCSQRNRSNADMACATGPINCDQARDLDGVDGAMVLLVAEARVGKQQHVGGAPRRQGNLHPSQDDSQCMRWVSECISKLTSLSA